MKLRHWFADQVVQRSQDVADLYVRLDDHRGTETASKTQELQWQTTENTILRDLREAHSKWRLAIVAFEDLLVVECTDRPDEDESDDDAPWDF